jgi:hypothetical protein
LADAFRRFPLANEPAERIARGVPPYTSEERLYASIARRAIAEAKFQGRDPAEVFNNALGSYGSRFNGDDKAFMRKSITDLMNMGGPDKAASPILTAGVGGSRTPQQAAKFETPGSPEWEAAKAKGLDMSQAGRMARANEMGFDTETVLYHGTTRSFDSFDPKTFGTSSNAESAQRGVFLTTSPTVADFYGDLSAVSRSGELYPDFDAVKAARDQFMQQKQTMPLYVRGRIKTIDMEGAQYRANEIKLSKMLDEAKAEGYDGLRLNNFKDGPEVADIVTIFDPSNIRSVNAAFDPDNAGSANLLASQRGGPLDEMADDALDVPPEEPGLSLTGRIAEAGLYAGGAAAAGGAIAIGMGWDGIQRTEPEIPPEDMTPAEFARWKAQEEAVMRAEMEARGQTREPAPITYNPLPMTPEAEQNMARTEEALAIKERRRRGLE